MPLALLMLPMLGGLPLQPLVAPLKVQPQSRWGVRAAWSSAAAAAAVTAAEQPDLKLGVQMIVYDHGLLVSGSWLEPDCLARMQGVQQQLAEVRPLLPAFAEPPLPAQLSGAPHPT